MVRHVHASKRRERVTVELGHHTSAGRTPSWLRLLLACLALLVASAATAPVASAGASGVLLWQSVIGRHEAGYATLTAVAADAAGNGYFGGAVMTGGNGLDAVVTRLSSAGTRAWTYTWDGAAHGNDGESMVAALDVRAGRLYVAFLTKRADGRDGLAVLCLTTGGRGLWVRTFAAPQDVEVSWPVIAVDTRGNVGVGTASYEDTPEGWVARETHLLKYSAAGELLWRRSWAPPGGGFEIAAIARGANGRLCLTGTTYRAGEARDIATLMYTASGGLAWTRIWSNPHVREGSSSDRGLDVVGVPGGAVVVAGYTGGATSAGDLDAVVLKYAGNGALAWARVRDEGGARSEAPGVLAADAAGNVYAAGWAVGADGSEDGYLLSYAANGTYRWTSMFDDPGGYDQEIESVAVAGNRLYFAGRRYSVPADLQCVLGLVMTGAGDRRWVTAFDGGTIYQETWPAAMAVVPAKSVYVAAGAASGEVVDGVALRFAP